MNIEEAQKIYTDNKERRLLEAQVEIDTKLAIWLERGWVKIIFNNYNLNFNKDLFEDLRKIYKKKGWKVTYNNDRFTLQLIEPKPRKPEPPKNRILKEGEIRSRNFDPGNRVGFFTWLKSKFYL